MGISAKGKHGAVAAGHPAVAAACSEILEDGGNAFDAALAGLFMGQIAEPVLTSLGGGGFLLAQECGKDARLFDFFTQTPKKMRPLEDLDFYEILVDYGSTQQGYHVGLGSTATPGMVSGAFAIHRAVCSLPITRIMEPAIRAARKGVEMDDLQASVLQLVKPIYYDSPRARPLFESREKPGSLLQPGEYLRLENYAHLLEALAREGEALFYQGEVAQKIIEGCKAHGGLLRAEDLSEYKTMERRPLVREFHGARIATNPPPASGGALVAFGLELLREIDFDGLRACGAGWLKQLAHVMELVNDARRAAGLAERADDASVAKLFDSDFMASYRKAMHGRLEKVGGTTQISVIDAKGNAASMTISNGEGCGYMIPDTDVMLNNMLGEADLHPSGFFTFEADHRISSMMAPVIATARDGRIYALGSGGANRIRTALLQLLMNLLAFDMPLETAVNQSRIDLEAGLLNIEGGHDAAVLARFLKEIETSHGDDWTTQVWDGLHFYFGGTHSVACDAAHTHFEASGDPRRGGAARIV